ncbi:MAG: sensor histidine kinase [Terriglobales bacterium]
MHPLLNHRRRLLLYAAAWIPPAVLLAYLLAANGLSAGHAVALAASLIVVFAFACLPVWYTCRALPLGRNAANAIGAQAVSAVVAGALWMLLAHLLAFAFGLQQPPAPSLLVVWAAGVSLYLLIAAGYYMTLEAERAAQAHTLAREAELRALKAQINPHFLYNSLNSISALTSADPARAREMCVLLGDFLRRTLALGAAPAPVPLAQELALTRSFLAVEQVRFGARLQFEEAATAEALAALIPALLLQPLVENAVVHGISQMLDGGRLALHAACRDQQLTIELVNPYDPEAAPRTRSSGLGLANVRERLQALFGQEASLAVQARQGMFRVIVSLPCA